MPSWLAVLLMLMVAVLAGLLMQRLLFALATFRGEPRWRSMNFSSAMLRGRRGCCCRCSSFRLSGGQHPFRHP